MSCEQCRSNSETSYTGMICDMCQQPIGPATPPDGKVREGVPGPGGRWYPMSGGDGAVNGAMLPGSPDAPSAPANDVPASAQGWCWGGFFLTWIWAIPNRTWAGFPALVSTLVLARTPRPLTGLTALLPLVYLAVSVWLLLKGRQLAWKNARWKDVDHFNRGQRRWTVAGIGVWALLGMGALLK